MRAIFFSIGALFVFVPALALAHAGLDDVHVDVLMTSDGFVPERVSIPVGGTILFENNDTRERWPATNIHPTHHVYPGSGIEYCNDNVEELFDACRPLAPGESFLFTFDEPGEWRYHDHLHPNEGGIIRVTGERAKERFSLSAWFRGILDATLFAFERLYVAVVPGALEEKIEGADVFEVASNERAIKRLVRLAGPARVMEELLEESEGASVRDCHQEAHQVGRAAYEVFGASVFEEGDASCHSGYYHGAMEAFLSERGDEDLAASIERICSTFTTRFGVFECLHGVGHGLMAYENYDLPAALADCERLRDGFSTRSCYGGVFMENVVAAQGIGAIVGHETQWVSQDPHFPCNAIGEDYLRRYECYQMQTSWMLTLAGYELEPVAQACRNAPRDLVDVCFKSLGRDIAGITLRDADAIVEHCERVATRAIEKEKCYEGAVNVVIDFWGPALEGQANDLCAHIDERGLRQGCFDIVTSRTSDLEERAAEE